MLILEWYQVYNGQKDRQKDGKTVQFTIPSPQKKLLARSLKSFESDMQTFIIRLTRLLDLVFRQAKYLTYITDA